MFMCTITLTDWQKSEPFCKPLIEKINKKEENNFIDIGVKSGML